MHCKHWQIIEAQVDQSMKDVAFHRLGRKMRRISIGRLAGCAILALTVLQLAPTEIGAQSPTEALFQAVAINDISALEAAIDAGADMAATNEDGMTPADLAVDLGHFRAAHVLLARRTEGRNGRPRVTDKGREAVAAPRARLQDPDAQRPAQPPRQNPILADITPPQRPTPPTTDALADDTATPEIQPVAPVPELPPESTITELPATPAVPPAQTADEPEQDGGLLSGLWSGVKDVVTLGGLFGDAEEEQAPPEAAEQAAAPRLSSPADRFFSKPAAQSDSAAGRMVDRMRDMVGADTATENEFGLPQLPVVPPVYPTDDGAPSLALPPLQQTSPRPDGPSETPSEVPGLVPPIASSATVATVPSPLDVPDLPGSIELPASDTDLGIPELSEETGPVDTADLDIPGLPPELSVPGLPSDLRQPDLSDEIPGIIPPPSTGIADIPGLEALPGSVTGEFRRPGGLIQPDDPNVLPPPGSNALQDRLRRIDEILNREPAEVRNRFGGRTADTSGAVPPIGSAPAKPPVQAESIDTPRRPSDTLGVTTPRDPSAILRSTRERRAGPPSVVQPLLPAPARDRTELGHQLRPPTKGITTRDEPASRLADRLARITERPYPDDDIYGLPIVRPSVDGTAPPRADIVVTELEKSRQDQTDARIHALARFFRGNQEEDVGMQPPNNTVASEPLPRVIDNLIPENDPARNQVVDDRLLDLSGIASTQPELSQPGASATRNGRLDERFLDRLTSVLGPTQTRGPSVSGQNGDNNGIGLNTLDIPEEQIVQKPKPDIPDPWTMTVERSDPTGDGRTLGVTAISPNDGSEIRPEQGTVQSMVGRIRQLLVGPEGPTPDTNELEALDDIERQQTAEELLSEALRDGTPMALPDQSQWSVTEVDPAAAPIGVPPRPRPGALTRTSLQDVVLSIGESVTLENTLPPQQDGLDPTNECIKKNRGTTLFCVESVDWPSDLRQAFSVPTILYTGPMAITRYDQGIPSRFHSLFDSNEFEDVVAYFQARYGEPTEIWKRSIAPLAQPRMDNPTVTWRSRSSRDNVISVLEVRKFDDTRGGFPDTTRGAVMLYHHNAAAIFPQVSSHELMRLRRTR